MRAKLCLGVAVVLAGLAGAAARADDPALVSREYADLACRILIPASWSEAPASDPPGVRFRKGGRALRAELTALAPRRDLDEMEGRLRASGREVGLALAESPRRFTVDGRPALRLLFEGDRAGTKLRHLAVAIDAPTRTYLVLIGDRADELDVALADRVAASLERTGGAGTGAEEPSPTPGPSDAPPGARAGG